MSGARSLISFVGRNGRRVVITVVGGILVLAGLVMMVAPGPGGLTIIAGLALLGTEYTWARRLLDSARRRVKGAAKRLRRAGPG
jgi:uncharacterized protein (TIGR02611 family)